MGSSFRWNDIWTDGVTDWVPAFAGMTVISDGGVFSPSPTGRGVGVRVGARDHAHDCDARLMRTAKIKMGSSFRWNDESESGAV